MARYRKIDVRMRSDEKFRALSAPPPNGQDCWIYLLTNRYTTSIPGVYAAFEETLARDLGWSLEGFREAFREVSEKGMAKADWEVGLVFIPKAIQYDPPQSGNVIRSWREHWDELPECSLKDEALSVIKAYCEAFSEGYRKAFADTFGKACPNQEQEQEQEQDIQIHTSASPPAREVLDFDAVYRLYPRKGDGKTSGIARLKRHVKTPEVYGQLMTAVRNYAEKVKAEKTEARYVKQFSTWCNGNWRDYVDGSHAMTSGSGASGKKNFREAAPHAIETKDRTHEL